MTDNITPLIPMTQRQLMLMSPDERRDYWIAVAAVWTRNVTAARNIEFQRDYDAARHADDWCGS